MKTLEWLLVAGGVILFGVVIFGLYKASTQPKNLPEFSAPTPHQPFLSGPQSHQIDYQRPATFGAPTHQHQFHGSYGQIRLGIYSHKL